ncbi:unnamed protein product [Rhizoctonia solani]|uniref:Ubiquitin-like domain-containing protein n=1 Tax=Rhizoctonia solani TaxID=456999 RepID=A0A8H3EAT7_9AGAM|nr:unnamed protein product [Rhizoctonia solani]
MKITARTLRVQYRTISTIIRPFLQQKKFEVEAEPHETVLDLKEKIGGLQGHPAKYVKLYYAGKTLTDDSKSVESLNLKEGAYLTVLLAQASP